MTHLRDDAIAHLRAVIPGADEGRYRLGPMLGRGGMGVVYEAFDCDLERDVALKVLLAPAPTAGEEERLRREARILARLEHPGIVPVHDVGRLEDGRLFYVMKRIRGRRLDEATDPGRPLRDRLALLERAAEAVAFAHVHGVLHRDLKPSNILVGDFGEVLVVDWGVAAIGAGTTTAVEPRSGGPPVRGTTAAPGVETGAPGEARTGSGTILGTPGWMSPEQAAGDVERFSPATDVWGLGATLHWLLFATPPTSGPRPESRAAVRPPRRLEAILDRSLALDPRDRYANADGFLCDLKAFRDEGVVTAYREGPLDRLGRFVRRYRTPILLIVTYVLVRILIYLYGRI